MKVLHVINSLVAAGAENSVVSLVNEQSMKAEVSLFTFYSEKDFFDSKLKSRVKFYPNKGQKYFSFSKLKKLLKLIKANDIIHVHLFPPFYIVGLMSFFFKKKKLIYTEHSTYNSRRKIIFKLFEKFIYSRYDEIVCISSGVEDRLIKWMGSEVKTTVINNAINICEIEKIDPINRKELGLNFGDVVLVMVGRFQKEKDQETLIRALSLLPKKFVLLLIGEGENKERLKELVGSLNLNKRVLFLGLRKDIYKVIKSCDYGVLSSNWEGFGLVALEYIACDIVSIGSNVKGLREVIGEKKCLFNKGDFKSLANTVIQFEKNDELRSRIQKNQKNHLQEFDISNHVKKHFEVYSNFLI